MTKESPGLRWNLLGALLRQVLAPLCCPASRVGGVGSFGATKAAGSIEDCIVATFTTMLADMHWYPSFAISHRLVDGSVVGC